ncbi:MAG TPA: hypothetical protein VIG99_32215 [Myxococcaceae bacterium]|jgi:hypothetical protein
MRHLTLARACALTLALGLAPAAGAQQYPDPYQPQPYQPQPPPPPPYQGTGDATVPQQPPPQPPPPPEGTVPPAPPPEDPYAGQEQPGQETSAEEDGSEDQMPQLPPEAMLDGHPRNGPFLAGPGSLSFITSNTVLAALGGFGTQLISFTVRDAATGTFRFDFERGKESMLVGTLIGAGLGFAASTWWQFTHWMDSPVATFSLVNGLYAGMLAAGLVDSLSTDITALAYASFISAELGLWLTAGVGGGELRLADGLAMASGGAWAAAYSALILATITYGGGRPPSSKTWVDALLITPGLGAAALACALVQIHPTANQVVRGDLFGAGVGVVVLVASGFIVGFNSPTPYILTLLSSAGALAAVSIFWEEAAEKPAPLESLFGGGRRKLASKKKPYNNPWW